jgi:hypothetical protein
MWRVKRTRRIDPRRAGREGGAPAELAVEMASDAAAKACRWAQEAGVGEDDAAEATQAALRARQAAERARTAVDGEALRRETAAAWAAAESALEADQRVIEAIAEGLEAH